MEWVNGFHREALSCLFQSYHTIPYVCTMYIYTCTYMLLVRSMYIHTCSWLHRLEDENNLIWTANSRFFFFFLSFFLPSGIILQGTDKFQDILKLGWAERVWLFIVNDGCLMWHNGVPQLISQAQECRCNFTLLYGYINSTSMTLYNTYNTYDAYSSRKSLPIATHTEYAVWPNNMIQYFCILYR